MELAKKLAVVSWIVSFMNLTKRFGPPRLFVIESNLAECSSMGNILSRAGYQVDVATDAGAGLARVLEVPPQCLILSAIVSGTSGYALCRQVRTRNPFPVLPIIIVGTGNTLLNQNYALRVGANGYLSRPFSEDELLQMVKKLLPATLQAPMPQTSPLSSVQRPVTNALPNQEEYAFIPYRLNEVDIMLNNNPFARSSIMSDRELRHLYTLIDGQRNIQELIGVMQTDGQATLKLLKTLWLQHYIAFYDSKRHQLKQLSLFDTIT